MGEVDDEFIWTIEFEIKSIWLGLHPTAWPWQAAVAK